MMSASVNFWPTMTTLLPLPLLLSSFSKLSLPQPAAARTSGSATRAVRIRRLRFMVVPTFCVPR